jgi:hypothetical protein
LSFIIQRRSFLTFQYKQNLTTNKHRINQIKTFSSEQSVEEVAKKLENKFFQEFPQSYVSLFKRTKKQQKKQTKEQNSKDCYNSN